MFRTRWLGLVLLSIGCTTGVATEPDGGVLSFTSSTSSGGGGSFTVAPSSSTSTSTASSASSASATSAAASSSAAASGGGGASSSSDPGFICSEVGSSSSSGGGSTLDPVVYAHTATVLYELDPDTLELTEIGDFTFVDEQDNPLSGEQMTDIAIDGSGRMYGTTYTGLFRVLPDRLARRIVTLTANYNGLSFVPAPFMHPNREVLVATNNSDGVLYRLDTVDGTATAIGPFGNNWTSSGDVVAIRGDGIYATLVQDGGDSLARINPCTGEATILGPIGYNDIYGLGYWGGTLYGFSGLGRVVSINRETGVGTSIKFDLFLSYFGAGVTTVAKVAP